MKKYMVLCAGMCVAMAFTSCKSKESAYKKAYEKAKAQETALQTTPVTTVVEAPVQTVTPVVTKPVTETTVTNVANVSVREEKVTVVSGNGLKNFSVVVGSFGIKANAENLQQQLRDGGYDAQIVKNEANNMYRVIASTFDSKEAAVQSRDAIRGSKYNAKSDAWLLFNLK